VEFEAIGQAGETSPLDLGACELDERPLATADGELLIAPSGIQVVANLAYYRRDLGGLPPGNGVEPSTKPIGGTTLRLSSLTTGYDQTATTDGSGACTFPNVPPAADYRLSVVGEPGYFAVAADARDYGLIPLKIIGHYPDWTGNQEVAGDVTGNGRAGAFDSVVILMRNMGLIGSWPNGVPDWQFLHAGTLFNANVPLEGLVVEDPDADGQMPFDALGIHMGDVSGNWGQ